MSGRRRSAGGGAKGDDGDGDAHVGATALPALRRPATAGLEGVREGEARAAAAMTAPRATVRSAAVVGRGEGRGD
jgi:hypothetical protein